MTYHFYLNQILQSRIGLGIGGYGPGISSSHPFPNATFQGTLAGMPSSSTQFPPLPQVKNAKIFENSTFQILLFVKNTDVYVLMFMYMLQTVLDHEFQSFYGMGYDSNTTLDNMGPNGIIGRIFLKFLLFLHTINSSVCFSF